MSLLPRIIETNGPSAVSGMSARPGSWLGARLWLVDGLVAGGVFLYNLPILPMYVTGPGHAAALLAVSVVLCASYLFRRRAPLQVLSVMLLTASVQLSLGAPLLAADAMLLFAVYNAATRYIWRVSLLYAALTVGWLLVAAVPHLGNDMIDVGQLGVLIVLTLWLWTSGTLVRIRREYVAALRGRAEQVERERAADARTAVAHERARIAREIHDIVSHSLSVVVVMSDGAASKVETEPERAKSAMLDVRDTGRAALVEMRRMLGVLREDEPGSHAPQPRIAQLDTLIEQSQAAGLPVTLVIEGEPRPLSYGLELTVYRLVQESLTNVHKHAGPDLTRVSVLLCYRTDEIEVRVTDDGRGPLKRTRIVVGGHGHMGMRERVAAHGGTVAVGPREGKGFEVVSVLPVEGGT